MVNRIEDLPHAFNELNNRLARIEKAITDNKGEDRDQVLTVREAAKLLDLRPATIYTKVNKGELPYSRNAGKLRFSRNELVKWATERSVEQVISPAWPRRAIAKTSLTAKIRQFVMSYKFTNAKGEYQQPAEQPSSTEQNIDVQKLNKEVSQGPLGKGQSKKEGTRAFPIDTLPAPCRQFIQEARDVQNLDPAFTGAAVLAVLSSAIGNSRELQLKEKRKEHAALFIGIVGRPGSGKTPAHKLVFEPLKDFDDRTYKEYQDQVQAYNDWAKSGKEAESEPPEAPFWKRKLVNDHTIEVLADILDCNPRGVCLYVDELATWFDSFNRYNSGPDLERWLSIWSRDHFTVDRKNKQPVKVSKPFCSVFGGIQPSVLPRLFKEEKGHNGFTDRILFASETPERPPDTWRTGDMDWSTIDDYKKCIEQLNELLADESD